MPEEPIKAEEQKPLATYVYIGESCTSIDAEEDLADIHEEAKSNSFALVVMVKEIYPNGTIETLYLNGVSFQHVQFSLSV